MVATGRVSSADALKPEKTGVKLDDRGYIQVNEFWKPTRKTFSRSATASANKCSST